ncbi:hypothetical protein [Nitrobacter winogradskyi]|uniref:Uncharacterized protein n=2 Tax=Nitrobacter winogradskyi TaxID=913 RepID=A0ACC6AMD6_NITWI|nr:hypothetical protein [Nitrobacter winogradskyi]MCP2000628.1 hypothetical protein [Nitrobacter winogradskyi]GEC15109.1 hypothetical protein NWI01_10010 [Nitrobacter winogradskyi]
MRHASIAALVAGCLCAPGLSIAQEQVIWRETQNLPVGLNLPAGMKADVLGIAVGGGYSDAKAKLQALLSEAPPAAAKPMTESERFAAERSGSDMRPPLTEETTVITMHSPGTSARVEATYIGDLRLARQLPGSGAVKIREEILVRLSAPSSGHQVLGVERRLAYDSADEPRVSEIIARLAEKFGGQPQVYNGTEYRFQFNDGAAYVPPQGTLWTDCYNYHVIDSSQNLPLANRTGTCDVLMTVRVSPGKSSDHARELTFILSDNERAKQNVGADYAFMSAYIDELAKRSSGVAPKL